MLEAFFIGVTDDVNGDIYQEILLAVATGVEIKILFALIFPFLFEPFSFLQRMALRDGEWRPSWQKHRY